MSSFRQAPTSALPAELWLLILEQTSIQEASHLWLTVRRVSPQFRDLVERLFSSSYLTAFAMTLSLPRRDPTSGALLWPGTPIPRAQMSMLFNGLSSDGRYVYFKSPSVLSEGTCVESVEELKNTSVLPLERLEAAAVWVHFTQNQLTGLQMHVPRHVSWNGEQGAWIWKLEWKNLITQFYEKKREQRLAKAPIRPMTGRQRWLKRGHEGA
ncbi:hypothetical protein J4E91_008160 [Alternaria rosae]|nr:hypothetical protein J4E91_008160 [Alternaria rosae]